MMLPTGLAHHASRLDDVPQVRGAVAFGRMVRESAAGSQKVGISHNCPDFTSAIDRLAALAIGSAYRAQDRR